jgi:hypothetical protein
MGLLYEAIEKITSSIVKLMRCRALGTALEWPEARKNADKVRKWGIEVSSLLSPLRALDFLFT